MSLSPFDWINSISSDKVDLKEDPENIKSYNPFMINNGLSYFHDTLLFANEMNIHHDIPHNWQYDFLNGVIHKKKRFRKWDKKEVVKDLDVISEYYKCSNKRALEIMKILTSEQIEIIVSKMEKGGK